MSKSNFLENALLELIFNAVAITGIADVELSSQYANLYVSFHTADPGEAGDQESNECSYTDYARVAVVRSGSGWVVTGSAVSPDDEIVFPAAGGGTETITHFGVGTDPTGPGNLLYSGTVTPNISVTTGVTPILTTATTITED